MSYTALEKQKEAEREVFMREKVYPGKVEAGALDRNAAQRRIAIMRAIAADYAKLAEKERLI